MKLKGRHAIVTGAANGIGQAIALGLAKEGANIAIADIDSTQAGRVVNEIKSFGCSAIGIKVDVTRMDEVRFLTETVLRRFPKIDILVNNAGVTFKDAPTLFHESAEDDWDFVLGVNLRGVFNCTRSTIQHMIKNGNGRIINISSSAGLVGTPALAVYSASKGGVISFTRALAKEVVQYGIRVNSVAPGATATRMNVAVSAAQLGDFDTNRQLESSGLGRFGKPEEIAAMVVYLATDDADFITGQVFPVCGLRNIGTY